MPKIVKIAHIENDDGENVIEDITVDADAETITFTVTEDSTEVTLPLDALALLKDVADELQA